MPNVFNRMMRDVLYICEYLVFESKLASDETKRRELHPQERLESLKPGKMDAGVVLF